MFFRWMFAWVIKIIHNIKKISIKNRPYYFCHDILNIKSFDPNLLNISKLSCKSANISIYYLECMTLAILDHVNIDVENLLYLIFNNVDGYIIEGINED